MDSLKTWKVSLSIVCAATCTLRHNTVSTHQTCIHIKWNPYKKRCILRHTCRRNCSSTTMELTATQVGWPTINSHGKPTTELRQTSNKRSKETEHYPSNDWFHSPNPSFSGLLTTVEISVANASYPLLFHVRSPECRTLTYSILCECISNLRYHGSRDTRWSVSLSLRTKK